MAPRGCTALKRKREEQGNCREPKTLRKTEEELTHVLWLLSVLMD